MSIRVASQHALVIVLAALLTAVPFVASAEPAPPRAAAQMLTWTADDGITRYRSAPTQAEAGATTIVFENSAATGNTTGMPHTLTFDTTTPGYNHDVDLNILAGPFDPNGGRHQATVTLTPGRYRYFCAIPGHGEMVGEFVVGGGPDTTPPTVSAEVSGTRNAEGHYVGAATVTVSASDAGSGIDTVEYEVDDTGFQPYTTPVRITAVGDHAVQFRATDKAGNVSPVGSVPFRVVAPPVEDTTPPTVSAEVSGTRNAEGHYVGAATVTVSASDAGSGVARVEYSLDGAAFAPYTAPVVVNRAGAHMLHYRAVDVAGNASAEKMVGFTVVAGSDACPDSDTRRTVIIRDDDTGVANVDTGNGCTINDLIAERAPYPDHATFVRHVETVTQHLVVRGTLTPRQRGSIVRAAARSGVGT